MQQQQQQRPVASTSKPTRKHAQRNASATKQAQKSPRRTVFVEDVTVIEYDLSDEERMDKRQAFRAIGRRRHMKRLRPDFKDMPNDEFGEMMFASNSWRCDKPAHSETPPTPINVQYASGVSSAARISPPSNSNSPNSPLFLNGAQSHNATSSQRARTPLQGHARRNQHYPQIRRATNVTRVNSHSLAKRKRAASDVSYWDMFLATILFIKLLATVVLSTAGRSNTEEHPSRKSVTYS
ncbi:Hypothetical Protein FCC1311_079392 [Hondaea fermentalgiana]|uniref:Uncharacterized protein n=1 Tax=Hondaea fermentalgiana TaxID=2315210 RepID=A0A2R5GUX3_9STRA|nr:Hypothetical Protein FCC1311_079392 [Hondaea fermentalgiana]|eukprot:GBG31714.1 Hypothetical Protein FCC1311_079392 [Hondaea fermentalgiana]